MRADEVRAPTVQPGMPSRPERKQVSGRRGMFQRTPTLSIISMKSFASSSDNARMLVRSSFDDKND